MTPRENRNRLNQLRAEEANHDPRGRGGPGRWLGTCSALQATGDRSYDTAARRAAQKAKAR